MFEFLKKHSEKKTKVAMSDVKNAEHQTMGVFADKPKESKMGIKIESQMPVPAVTQHVESAPATSLAAHTAHNPSAGLTIKPVGSSEDSAAKPIEESAKKGGAQAVPSAPDAKSVKPVEKKESNVFTDLFPIGKDKVKTNDRLVSSLNASTGSKSILKPKKGDEDLLLYKKPTLGANLLKSTLLIILLVSTYLYSQLSPTFTLMGENPVQERLTAYQLVVGTQSKINKQNYILSKYALDDFLYTTDSYLHKISLYNSSLTPQKEKAKLEKEFPTLRAKMREDLLLASEKFSLKLMPDNLPTHPEEGKNHSQEFSKSLKDAIRDSIAAASENPEELEFMRTVSKLTDNVTIKPALNQYQIPTMTDEEFAEMLALMSESNTSSFGTLNALRKNRAEWSEIISEIELVTKSIDPLFESKFLQERVGEIFYSSYTLDKANQSITVIGETFSDDGKNFSLSADLLDAFESSNMFKHVSMDSFSKSKEQSASFKGVLSIDLTLE